MKPNLELLSNIGLFKEDLDYQLFRASMVLIYILFGYQKWFEYEAQALISFRAIVLRRESDGDAV
jgi:uncharacterized membrane protein YkgB